jgi:molybdopterin-binding protein
MKIGARNKLEGSVINIKRGSVMCQVIVSVTDMGLKVGDKVRVAVKAVNVLLLKE